MKFVKEHLTQHHLLHKPHRWFLALLLSPVHALEVHYQHRYHLQFSHARKLFIFDMLLLSSIFVIGGLASFWYLYDPTVTKFVDLNLSISANEPDPSQAGRVLSGEELTLTASYKNNSKTDLLNPVLHFNLPPGFILESAAPGKYTTSTNSLILPDTKPKTGHEVKLLGRFFAIPNTDVKFATELVYRQPNHTNYEVRGASLLSITRGSILQATISAPATIYSQGSWESQLVLTNRYRSDLPASEIRFAAPTGTTVQFSTVSGGEIKNNIWRAPTLTAGKTVTGTIKITTNLPTDSREFSLDFTPVIFVNGAELTQTPASIKSKVVRPDLAISGTWNKSKLSPGQSADLNLQVKNSGDIILNDLIVNISLPAGIVNSTALRGANSFPIKNGALIISAKEIPELASLAPGQTKSISVTVPISNYPTGQTDLSLQLPIRVSARTIASESVFERKATMPGIQVGTNLRVIPDAHYYSLEGDQIGRGPLPPKVGKETKYWALLTVQNGTSEIGAVTMSATLAPGVVWTGKTNVSRGREPTYNASTRTLTWQTTGLPAHESAQINVELAVTPTPAQLGTIPLLLTNIRASGQDTFIEAPVSTGSVSLDARLDSDDFAQAKGVRVE